MTNYLEIRTTAFLLKLLTMPRFFYRSQFVIEHVKHKRITECYIEWKKCPSNFVMVGILIENCINLRQFSVRIFLRSDIHVKWWTRLGTRCLTHAAYNLRQIFSGSIFVHIISSGSCNMCVCVTSPFFMTTDRTIFDLAVCASQSVLSLLSL